MIQSAKYPDDVLALVIDLCNEEIKKAKQRLSACDCIDKHQGKPMT